MGRKGRVQIAIPVGYYRGHAGKAKIKSRLIRDLDPDDRELTPKPKWMRWRTYNLKAARCARLNGKPLCRFSFPQVTQRLHHRKTYQRPPLSPARGIVLLDQRYELQTTQTPSLDGCVTGRTRTCGIRPPDVATGLGPRLPGRGRWPQASAKRLLQRPLCSFNLVRKRLRSIALFPFAACQDRRDFNNVVMRYVAFVPLHLAARQTAGVEPLPAAGHVWC
jgi:hypothetical protein